MWSATEFGSAAVAVDYELPERPEGARAAVRDGLSPPELFSLYHESAHGTVPEPALIAGFTCGSVSVMSPGTGATWMCLI